MAVVITLTGASQCGKGTVMDMILGMENENFKPVIFPKHITRELRATDGPEVIGGGIPDYCDLVYEVQGNRYGIRFDDIYDMLAKGLSPILVFTDIRAVEDVKNALGSMVKSIYIYRRKAVFEEYVEIEKERYAGKDISEEKIQESALLRFQKAKDIYRIYIENISLFDKVVLNIGSVDQTKMQVESIIKEIIEFDFLKEFK